MICKECGKLINDFEVECPYCNEKILKENNDLLEVNDIDKLFQDKIAEGKIKSRKKTALVFVGVFSISAVIIVFFTVLMPRIIYMKELNDIVVTDCTDSVRRAYGDFLKNADFFSSDDESYCAITDISGDNYAELILEVWGGYISVYSFDESTNSVVELKRKSLGKWYNGQAYYNTEKRQVIFPSGATGGSRSYSIFEFSGNEVVLVRELNVSSEKEFDEDNKKVLWNEKFFIDGKEVSADEFFEAEETLSSGFFEVNVPVKTMIEKIEMIK